MTSISLSTIKDIRDHRLDEFKQNQGKDIEIRLNGRTYTVSVVSGGVEVSRNYSGFFANLWRPFTALYDFFARARDPDAQMTQTRAETLKQEIQWKYCNQKHLVTDVIPTDVIAKSRLHVDVWGKPSRKSKQNHGMNLDYVVSRVVMREISSEVRASLHEIHRRMGRDFSKMSDESLAWLLGGSSNSSRGGFKSVRDFRRFLSQDPSCISPSRLMTGIETIGVAIGYRGICAAWTQAPSRPVTRDQKEMFGWICTTLEDKTVNSISDVYKGRSQDKVREGKEAFSDDIVCPQDPTMSDASDCEENRLKPENKTAGARFRNKRGQGYSWVGAAEKSGIPIRNHTSGTTALCMAAIDGILRDFKYDKQALFGALLVPQYLRGDYHTFAETGAGMYHFMCERHGMASQEIHPKSALEYAYNSMIAALRDFKKKGEELSPKEALSYVLSHELQSKGAVPVQIKDGRTLVYEE